MPEAADLLRFWVWVWVGCMAVTFFLTSIRRIPSVGLIGAYVMNISVNHLFGAANYLLPWYYTDSYDYVVLGFRESAIGLTAFVGGAMVAAPILVGLFLPAWKKLPVRLPDQRLPRAYILTGFVFYFVLLPVISRIPSVGTLGFSGWSLMIVGLCLASWNSWRSNRGKKLLRWMLLAMAFPLVTMINQGFLGYGIAALIVIMSFVSGFYRPRWKIALGGFLAIYMGLSVFVTYLRDRNELREAVWYERQSLSGRASQVFNTFSRFELLDLHNSAHLRRIDERLNQNILVGQSVAYIGGGYIDYARGETLWQALIAFVPRILWPSKPVVAGSGDYVALYTGETFEENTSIGMGQVLEFYINFGRGCVLAGFFVLGLLVGFIDAGAAYRLSKGDWQGCTYWFLPGIAFLQAGGSLVEVASTFAASIVFCLLVNKYVLPRMSGRTISLRQWVRSMIPRGRRRAAP